MKDPLEYDVQELKHMSKEQLEQLLSTSSSLETRWNTAQLVSKTLMNSLYGALANKYFPLFNEDMAAAITGNGRFFIRKLAMNVENRLQSLLPNDEEYIVYGDTDSIYFSIAPFVNRYKQTNPNEDYVEWSDNFEKKVIQPIIKETIEEFGKDLNAYNVSVMGVEREIIADAAVFCAKKKYYARVKDLEGTRYSNDDPYIKVMGLEIIKSSTPNWSTKYLKEAIPHILDKDEQDLSAWVRDIKQRFIDADLNDIAASGKVSRLDYDLEKDTVPIGSRAAIRHNMYIEKFGLTDKYSLIQAGDKCKRLFLTSPNPFESNIIAFTNDTFVDEINKYNCVDYDTNFEKNFLKPLTLMVDSLNYNLEKETESLGDW